MIGSNSVPHHIHSTDDARAFAAAIAAIRATIDATEAEYQPHLAALKAEADTYRAERDGKTAPLNERADALRKVLADWLAADPDGNLRDGDRSVATLSRRKPPPVIDAAKVPDKYKTLTVDMAKLNKALINDEDVPGVTWKTDTVLRVL